jgi:hypothetical protein
MTDVLNRANTGNINKMTKLAPLLLISGGGVEKDHFNRRALKVFAKDTKLKRCISFR